MTDKHNRVVITAGGTGGHVFPALAVARALQQRKLDIQWVGSRLGIESRLVPEHDIVLHRLPVRALRGKSWRVIASVCCLLLALVQAVWLLWRLKPKMVLAMGGFASGPTGLAAWLLRIPLLVHEQNATAGWTNRILARFANNVLESFPSSFSDRVQATLTGNPLRQDFLVLPTPAQRYAERDGPLRVLVFGGSQGAALFNRRLPQVLASLPEQDRPYVWHQTGRQEFAATHGSYQQLQVIAYRLEAFIDDMAEAYAWADVVIARAGALTIAELSAIGLPSILVPYPHAADGHQHLNAQCLVDKGAAILIEERDLSATYLLRCIRDLVAKGREPLCQMALRAEQCAMRDATEQVVAQCLVYCEEGG